MFEAFSKNEVELDRRFRNDQACRESLFNVKDDNSPYARAKMKIPNHLQAIHEFLVTPPRGPQPLEKLRLVSTLGQPKVLVVEEDPALSDLIRSILLYGAEVDIASDGRQGLDHLRRKTFDAVISEIDLPLMDGIDMYIQALRLGVAPRGKYIFLTASLRPDYRLFLEMQKVTVLRKPASITQIRQAVFDGP